MALIFKGTRGFFMKKADLLLVILFSAVPLFMHFPYRVNIFLSWEGAYRLYLGQVPYKDFGLPMGFGFWIVPALFFKLFGPYLVSLIKAQVFLNILAGLSFRSLLKKLKIPDGIRIASVLIYCLSYILMNFWPWYNNSVILWQIIGLNLLMGFMVSESTRWKYAKLLGAAFFLFLSFFTKQDGGLLGLMLALALMFYYAFHDHKWRDLFLFIGFYLLIAVVIIYPFSFYGFGYWFNHGQPPHSSRLSIKDLLDEILGESQWIRFYVMMIGLLLIVKFRNRREFFANKREMLFLLLTLGILTEAAIFQVTSYTPPDNNIFFHSFSAAYLFSAVAVLGNINFSGIRNFFLLIIGVLVWWSGMYWKYFERIEVHLFPSAEESGIVKSASGENVINMHTFMLNTDTTHYEAEDTWKGVPGLAAFKNIYLPPSTVAGIERLVKNPVFRTKNIHVLNMTELTPLDYELGYPLEEGEQTPLWYHLGVAMFNRQTDTFCEKIRTGYYDIVLFEYIPSLNNFYPFRIRDTLRQYYQETDSFLAPRRPTNGNIEIYTKK